MIDVVAAYKSGNLTEEEARAILRIAFRLDEKEQTEVIVKGKGGTKKNDPVNNSSPDSAVQAND